MRSIQVLLLLLCTFLASDLRAGGADLTLPCGEGASGARLATAPQGDVLLSWVRPLGKRGEELLYSVRSGGEWRKAVSVHRSPRHRLGSWADPPTVSWGPSGWVALWLVPVSADSHGTTLVFSRSDDGRRWSAPKSVHDDDSDTEHGFASLVHADDGVDVAWLDGRAYAAGEGRTELRMRRLSEPLGEERILDDTTCDCCPTATGGSGTLAWRDRREGEIRDISVAGRRDDWTVRRATNDDWEFAGCPVNGPALATNEADLLVWFTGDEVPRVQALPLEEGWPRRPLVLDEGEGVLGRVSVAASGEGWRAVWVRAAGEERAHLLSRTVSPAGELGPLETLGELSAKRTSGFPSSIATSEGVLVVWQTDAGPTGALVGP